MQKEVTKAAWKKMKLVFIANENHGVVKQDAGGIYWEWMASGKRVTIKKQGT